MKIHLNSKQGIYTVTSYNDTYIWLVTKTLPEFKVPCSDFKTFAGGSFNNDVTAAESDKFIATVNPSMYQHQAEMTNKVMEALTALSAKQDELDEKHERIDNYNYDCFDEVTNAQYENWFHQKSNELDKYKDKMRKTASEVYKQKLDFSNLQIEKGIKFIIQQNREDNSYRFCFDPYGFVDNAHSMISNIFREFNWNTINGGWIRIFDKNVILYSKSGDYGVYDNAIAIEAAKSVFPNHQISSYAGREWDRQLTERYDDLPF